MIPRGARNPMSETYINRADIEQYVHDTLPWDEVSDWDIAAIADDITARWPDLIGHHPDVLDAALPNQRFAWLDAHIDAEAYWSMVKRHQVEP